LALIATQVFNYYFTSLSISQKAGLPFLIHWSVLLLAIALFILSIFMNYRLVKRELVEMKVR
jgi:amino acid transporter